jgi:hypothetical protein
MAGPRVNPRAEAEARLGGRYEVRVLEPSPPALQGNSDDPTARGEVADGRELVSPVSSGDITWDELARGDSQLAQWCSARWLGSWERLQPAPPGLVETRLALHRVAEMVVAPARRRATGNEIALRYTRWGFGTPYFADDRQIRVEGAEIVDEWGGQESRAPLTTLREAGALLGDLVDAAALDEEPLRIDSAAARCLGDWFAFGTLVVAEARARAGDGLDASNLNLWPEHFDVAAELGSEAAGQRAGYGASPGDDEHPAPYLYVAPWTARPEGELWNAVAFAGAEMTYGELLEAEDQVEAAVSFFEARLHELAG